MQEPERTGELFDYSVFIKGDVNLDGQVTIIDATLIQKYIAGLIDSLDVALRG